MVDLSIVMIHPQMTIKKHPRQIPTSELLYSDALDRRERLHIMKDRP